MNEICLHQFEKKLVTTLDGRVLTRYAPHAGFRSLVDVRGGDLDGLSLFSWMGAGPLPPEARLIANTLEDVLDGATVSVLSSALGLRQTLPAVRFADTLAHLLTTHADPVGTDAPHPLCYDTRGGLEVLALNNRVWQQKFDPSSPFCAATLDLLRRIYKKLKKESNDKADAMDPADPRTDKVRRHYRRWLGSFEKETGYSATWITQSEKEEDRPDKPETSISDNFVRANGTTIGNTLTWAEYSDFVAADSWQTVTNKAYISSGSVDASARAGTALSSANHTATSTVSTFTHVAGDDSASAACRDNGSSTSMYLASLFYNGTTEYVRFSKVVSSVVTALDTDIATTHSIPDEIKCSCNGSTMVSQFNGTGKHSFTDTSLASGTAVGIHGRTGMGAAGDVQFSAFSAADIPVPTRLYLPASAASTPISPAVSTSWAVTAPGFARAKTSTAKIGDAMATVSYNDVSEAAQAIVFRQWISAPLTVGQSITAGQAIKAQVRASQVDLGNNLFVYLGIRILNGTTVQYTLLDVTIDNTELATVLTNRQYTATEGGAGYTTVASDRLVIEMGIGGDPDATFNHDSSMRFGDADASDLPENDTDTTDKNPWVELTDTLTFTAEPTGTSGRKTLLGVGK